MLKTSLTRDQIIDTIRVLKNYKNALRQVGKRAILMDPRYPMIAAPVVEYTSGIETTFLKKYSDSAMISYFPDYTGSSDAITFRENKNLTSGIRIHFGDDLVDISFQKYMHLFQSEIL